VVHTLDWGHSALLLLSQLHHSEASSTCSSTSSILAQYLGPFVQHFSNHAYMHMLQRLLQELALAPSQPGQSTAEAAKQMATVAAARALRKTLRVLKLIAAADIRASSPAAAVPLSAVTGQQQQQTIQGLMTMIKCCRSC
jgi:hypothetical protein